MVDRQPLRSPPARIQPVKLAGFRVPVNGKQIAAHAVHRRLRVFSTALVAIAASIAEPPCSSTRAPACEAATPTCDRLSVRGC